MYTGFLKIVNCNSKWNLTFSKLLASLGMLLLFISSPVRSQTSSLENTISMGKLYVDETENLIKLSFFHDIEDFQAQLETGQAKLQVNIIEGDKIYKDVLFKLQKPIDGDNVVLAVQPPLTASIYKTEPREFELQWVTGQGIVSTSKKAILGSALQSLDLRPYKKTGLMQLFAKPALVVVLLSLILILIVPVLQKYWFKKNHIKKYAALEREKPDEDPFTFVTIDKQDQVVVLGDRTMLLTSWKRIKKLPGSRPAKEFSDFFDIDSEGSFFKPMGKKLLRANQAWYGLMGIFLGWILFVLLNVSGLGFFDNLFTILDGSQWQVSTILARDTAMGLALGVGYSLSMFLADHLHSRKENVLWLSIRKVLLRTALIAFAFFLQAIITGYLVSSPFMAGCIAWSLIGIAFVMPLHFKRNIKKRIFFGLSVGLGCFLMSQLFNTGYSIDLFGVYTPTFLVLGILGSLSAFIGQLEVAKLRLKDIPATLHEKVRENTIGKSYLESLEATGAKLKKAFKKEKTQEIDADYEEVG